MLRYLHGFNYCRQNCKSVVQPSISQVPNFVPVVHDGEPHKINGRELNHFIIDLDLVAENAEVFAL